MLSGADAQRLQDCLQGGGVALFGADTVYGLACDPEQPAAVARLYALKGRPPSRPAAVMFFALDGALSALPELVEIERTARALLPGPVTLLLDNPRRRYPLAGGPTPDVLGLRVPELVPGAAALARVSRPVLQSSANPSGGREACRLADVAAHLRAGADLVLDVGELPGVASTVVDVRRLASDGDYAVVREGALSASELARRLARGGGGD